MQIQIDIIPEGGAWAARGNFLVTMRSAEMKFFKGLYAECIFSYGFLDCRSTQLHLGMWILSKNNLRGPKSYLKLVTFVKYALKKSCVAMV